MAPAAQPIPSLAVRCNHAVDRGDLLRLLRLGIPAEEAGRLCGFVLIEQAEQPEPRHARPSATQTQPASEPKLTSASPQAAPPLWRAIGPDLRQPDPAERQRPACLDRVTGRTGDQLRATNPAIVPPSPLASPARLGSMLRRMLTIQWPGSDVDAPKLVRLLDHAFKERVINPLSTMLEDKSVGPGQRLAMTVTGQPPLLLNAGGKKSLTDDKRAVRIFEVFQPHVVQQLGLTRLSAAVRALDDEAVVAAPEPVRGTRSPIPPHKL